MYFSSLDPRTRVAEHQGPTNLRVRCHLGLEVPEGCGARVGGVTSGWQEGRCIVFDDSFRHEVWNDSDRRRLVLVLDLWHPDLSDDEVALLVGLHRYGAASGAIPKQFWARNDAVRRRGRDGASSVEAPSKNESSLDALRRAIAEKPGDARLHVALGHELSVAGRWSEAEASARAALALAATLPMAHNNLGWARQMQGDTVGAVASYQRALELDPSFGRARRNLASLLSRVGRFPEALALRRAELLAEPESPAALAAVVGEAMRAGDLRLASEHAAHHAALCRGTRWYPVARPDDPELPASVRWERVLTPSKLLHDINQFDYLQRRGILGDELSPVIDSYNRMLDTLRPLGPDARVPLVGAALAEIGYVYNRIVHVRPTPRVARALSSTWDPAAAQDEYLARRPNVVVVDNALTDAALESLRLFCLESTVWSENRYKHGRLGSMFHDGFNCPLLVQIAEELQAAMPRILTPRIPARQIWGYRYATRAPQETPHADFAFVNVNFWITPDEANLDPNTGGLLLYDVTAPEDWDHATYNNNAGLKIYDFLKAKKAKPTHIPYRYNRALIFHSDVFHATPSINFRSGFENRRMNVTVLFGARDRH
jgi:tetratricopeptide (TPR) repeat protein